MIDIDKLRELANRLGRDRTHWEGCQYEHPECAIWAAAREIDSLNKRITNYERSRCPECGEEIDPETCHCGEPMDENSHDGHDPVPIGCVCFYVNRGLQ